MRNSRGLVLKYRLATESDFVGGLKFEIRLSPAHTKAAGMLARGAHQRIERYLSELCSIAIEDAIRGSVRPFFSWPASCEQCDVRRRAEYPIPRPLGVLVAVKGARGADPAAL